MSPQVDEETPLLRSQQSLKPTPLPWFQFSIVMFLQLAEPLTSQVIYPFAPQVCYKTLWQAWESLMLVTEAHSRPWYHTWK